MKTVREAALYYTGRDAECRQTDVDHWPDAARETIRKMVEEISTMETLLQIERLLHKDMEREIAERDRQLQLFSGPQGSDDASG